MKESFQILDFMADDNGRMKISTCGAHALAHPARPGDPAPAADGRRGHCRSAPLSWVSRRRRAATTSVTSKFGLVERVEADPDDVVGGARRWRTVATGFDFGEPHGTGSPELVAASVALIATGLDENLRLARRYLTHLDDVPEACRNVAGFSTYR